MAAVFEAKHCAMVVVAASLLFSARGATGAPAILRHELAVSLHAETHRLSGTDNLTVRPDGAQWISLSLTPRAKVNGVTVTGRPVPFTFREGTLDIPLAVGNTEEETRIAVVYEATFNDPVPDNPVNTEDPGYGVAGTISPRGVFLSEEAGWYPGLPGSMPTWKVRVEATEGFEAVTAGRLLRRATAGGATFSEWEIDRPLPGIALSAGIYVIREASAGEIKLYTYFSPENDPLSGKYLDAVAGFLDLYQKLFGPYPFEKFAVVENFFPTGYGFPSYTLLGSAVVRLPFILETSLGHEIAHSWWGNGVRVDYSRGNWSEGLVTYIADHLYKERSSPEEGRDYRLKLLRDYATLVPPGLDFPLKEFAGRVSPASRAVGYGKAAMVFHMARKRAGDEAFFSGLRAVAREKMFRTATWDDFDRAMPRDRSTDPESFFRQWIDRPGAPVLALKDVNVEREGARWKVTGRLVQEKPYYELRVPLRLETERKSVDAILSLLGEEMPFELFADSRPARLVVDPEVDVFRRLDPSEIPPLVNGVRGSGSLLVVAARGLRPDILEASRILLAALGKDNATVLREEETAPAALAGHDVLYLGLPRGDGYLPPFPGKLSATAESFTLEGARYASPDDALFAVFPHPSDRGRVAALFLPFTREAASQAARKIPHYGKYSYLVFSGGTNRAKGTWAAAASPTVHIFSPGAR